MSNTIECYQATEHFAPFLRIETLRDRLALPYSTLLGITLSSDETILELDFASRTVTVRGRRLYEIFCTIASGRGEALFERRVSDEMVLGPKNKGPFISEIRIKETEQAKD